MKILNNELGYLRMRSAPTSESEDLVHIPVDTIISYTDEEDGWYKVSYSGKQGWVSGAYVAVQTPL